ncbi:hypothetical protein K1719_035844 [Acacia pycnantha]|nr:hypothetical protein K1719_035844 [Acacia pycnantha]
MMEAELSRTKEASQADPSIVVQPPACPPRHQKWKDARMKGDKYINTDVAEVASKIDSLEQQSSPTTIGKPIILMPCRGSHGELVSRNFWTAFTLFT